MNRKRSPYLISLGGAVLLIAAFAGLASAQQTGVKASQPGPPTIGQLLSVHEVFRYEVRYSFFKLGEVKVEVTSDTLYKGQKAWWMRTIITSNPGIPFVGHEENHYNSIFVTTDSLPHSLAYWKDDVDENKYEESRYDFDHIKRLVYAREEQKRDTLALEEPASSGQLIFLIGRLYAGTDTNFRIPVYLDLKKGYISVSNGHRTEMRKYDAFEQPVKAYYSEGSSTIEGPFGFKGSFTSWYGADSLRIPLEARVKVWLGNVKVRLIEYTRKDRK